MTQAGLWREPAGPLNPSNSPSDIPQDYSYECVYSPPQDGTPILQDVNHELPKSRPPLSTFLPGWSFQGQLAMKQLGAMYT